MRDTVHWRTLTIRVLSLLLFILPISSSIFDNSWVSDGDIEFYLWNNKTSNEPIYIDNYGHNLNTNANIKILVHGWTDSINSFWYNNTIEPYVSIGSNVIAVGWTKHAFWFYNISADLSEVIGEIIARFIIGLNESLDIPFSKIHIIGHSLGAHIAAFAGQYINDRRGDKIFRITGLDPSGPMFEYRPDDKRLSVHDAEFVDTIILDAGFLGMNTPLGHVNFWVNGGKSQPCFFRHFCGHIMAPAFYNEGILSDALIGRKCDNNKQYESGNCNTDIWNVMGENTNFSIPGNYFVETNNEEPFSKGYQND